MCLPITNFFLSINYHDNELIKNKSIPFFGRYAAAEMRNRKDSVQLERFICNSFAQQCAEHATRI